MDRRQAREAVNQMDITRLYTFMPSKGKDMYVCPICGSGTGPSHTGALKIREGDRGTQRIKCHSGRGCFGDKGEDVLGALRLLWGTDENGVFSQLHIDVDDSQAPMQRATAREDFSPMENQNPNKTEQHTHSDIHTDVYTQSAEANYSAFYAEARKHIAETDYHRGLSLDTLNHFNIGYAPAWRHPKAPEAVPTSPRLIVPTSPHSYLARDTRKEIPEAAAPYAKSKVGKVRIFNAEAIQGAQQPIYIVEGEIDAMSIYDVGGEAVALGSTAYVNLFLEGIRRAPRQPFIIALDNDEAGKDAANGLREGLKKKGATVYTYSPCMGYKDANDALQGDREDFAQAVKRGADNPALAEYEQQHPSAADRLQDFIDGIADSVNTPCIPTGFSKLDEAIDGGFYPSLTLVGGLSSLGKTSLVLQIADQVAASGIDVLYFSLEMAEAELISKSVSRHTLLEAQAKKLDVRNAKSARGVTDGARYINYSRAERELINTALQAYGAYAKHIRIIRSGLGRTGVAEIREAVERHIQATGRKPLVICDYLQIIRPSSDRMTDKQAADEAVTELKNLSSDTSTAIIAISSLNRASYKEAISMEALKESGGLEYGSDIVIGLQLVGAGTKGFDPTEAKKRNPRQVEAVILKNRNGKVGDKVAFDYHPLFNFFVEA